MIQSDLFTFIIGEEQKPFTVHSNAIAATSDAFRALIQGGLCESEARCAELSDVEPDDFVRFLEFAYRGDYAVPLPTCIPDNTDNTTSERWNTSENAFRGASQSTRAEIAAASATGFYPAADSDDEVESAGPVTRADNPWDSFSPRPSKKKAAKKSSRDSNRTLRSLFENHRYMQPGAPSAGLLEGAKPKGNSAPDQDFTPVFLGHARLYTFAEMRLVYPLKDLALHKLHATLLDFRLYDQRVGDVVELARYAYSRGPDRSGIGGLDELRQLVVEYMACEVDTIGKHVAFQALLEEGGEFVTDFWGLMSRYLLVT